MTNFVSRPIVRKHVVFHNNVFKLIERIFIFFYKAEEILNAADVHFSTTLNNVGLYTDYTL